MHTARVAAAAAVLMAVGNCAYAPTPVPVVGEPSTLLALAGEWYGEYWTLDAAPGRNGHIYFHLAAGRDTADGHVLMTVHSPQRDVPWSETAARYQGIERHEMLLIRFVSASFGTVTGTLASYTDPTCGCTLTTTFHGTVSADSVAGTFTSLHASGQETGGRWYARRITRESSGPSS